MASVKVAARAQSATVRSAVSPVASVAARKPRAAALRVDAFVSQPNIASKPEDAQKSFLDMAMSAVMSCFDDQPPQNARYVVRGRSQRKVSWPHCCQVYGIPGVLLKPVAVCNAWFGGLRVCDQPTRGTVLSD